MTHVARMRRVRGTFVHFPRASGVFTTAINTPHPPQTVFTPLDLTPSLELSKPRAAATSIVAGEEELHCLDLVTVVLAPAADFFILPPP